VAVFSYLGLAYVFPLTVEVYSHSVSKDKG